MSNQFIAYGAKMERSTDGTTYTNIPEAEGIAVPAVEKAFVEVTSLDSPDGHREYITGLKDAGTISFMMGYSSTAYKDQLADSASGQLIYYKVTFPLHGNQTTNDTFIFKAYPTPKIENSGIDEAMKIAVDLRVSGAPTWVEGA